MHTFRGLKIESNDKSVFFLPFLIFPFFCIVRSCHIIKQNSRSCKKDDENEEEEEERERKKEREK